MNLGPYQLEELLSSSSACLWYRAKSVPDQRIVELGVLRDDVESDRWRVRISKQLHAAALIHFPGVRSIEHLTTDAQPSYLVVEWFDGPTLLAQQGESPSCDVDVAFDTACQIASGLAACHRVGLVHKALEPRTVRARQRAAAGVQIPGFERTAWTIDPTESLREFRGSEPTAAWPAAPEVRQHGETSAASDVFALGCLLHWLLFAQPPPTGKLLDEAMLERTVTAVPSLGSSRSEIVQLLCEMFSEEPSDRPQASEVAARLDSLISSRVATDATIAVDVKATQHQSPVADEPTADMPTQLGRFKLLEKLGQGGMGAVYRGQDLADGSIVALKVISAGSAATASQQQRFFKEARVLAQVRSAYVANLLEFNTDDRIGYLVLEFVPGSSIGDWLRQHGKLTEAGALAVASDIARGVGGAHQRGIVHRDIKPDNVLLTAAGAALLARDGDAADHQPLIKVTDFGLARSEEQTESLAITQQGALLGTPLYMSPEQCFGRPTDARSDVYSLGATLFHLLTGRPPFESKTQVGVMQMHCNDRPPSLSQLDPTLSEGLARVVEKTLAKNPDARYANADELLADLVNLSRGRPTSLVVHPPLPQHDSSRVQQFVFQWEMGSSPAQLWPFVANTDRLNQAMGLPAARFSTQVDPERGVRRFAETRIAGQKIAWEEHPFEWIEGRRMSVLRQFSTGPFRWFVNVVELLPRSGGGSTLVHQVQLEPANWLGYLLAKVEIGIKARSALTRIYQQIDGYIAGGKVKDPTADAFRRTTALSRRRQSRLIQRLDQLRQYQLDPAVVDTLGQFLQHAPDQEIARIRPRAFAERFGLIPEQVLSACLHASREGLLVLLWDILCPSCRIPADVKESLATLQNHGHCEACQVDFELDFANSIEMIFRAAPEIRDVEVQTYCIGGPAFSAHAVAQSRIAVGERFEMELGLVEGLYRIRGPQLPFAVDFRVSPRGATTCWELLLGRPPIRETVPTLQTGSQIITLTNDSPGELQVRLERTASRHDAVTAADASALALFRELFPGEILSPGQMVNVATVTLMIVQLDQAAELYAELGDGAGFDIVRTTLSEMSENIALRGGAVVKFVGEGLLATFNDSVAAVQTAIELNESSHRQGRRQLGIRISLHRGPAMVTTLNDRLDYFGSSVHLAVKLLESARAGDLVLTDALLVNREITKLLDERGIRAEVVATLLPGTIAQRCRLGEPAAR